MLHTAGALVDSILRATLLSSDVNGDETADLRYPPHDFQRDPVESVDSKVSYFRFFLDHAAHFAETMDLLADDHSRELLHSLILFRILGYRRATVLINRTAMEEARSRCDTLPEPPSPLRAGTSDPYFATLSHYAIPQGDTIIKLDCLRANIFFTFFLCQYYFSRSGVTIAPTIGDVAIDAGACFGDTALGFAATVGDSGQVHTFEILSSHLDILRHNIGQNPELKNIHVYPCALTDRDVDGGVGIGSPDPGYSVQAAPTGLRMRTLDNLVETGCIPRVDFIKMDMEGGEMAALRGAVESIRRFRPKLAISIYHLWDDYFTIPMFIHNLGLGYRMYLENYTTVDGETVLYATCADSGEKSDGSITPVGKLPVNVMEPPL